MVADLSSALGRPLEDALEGRALDVVVEHDADGWTASLYWRGADGAPAGTRVLRDASGSCDAIARSTRTSVLVALGADAIDVAAGPSTPPSPSPSPSPAPITLAPSPSPPPPPITGVAPPASTPATPGDVTIGGLLAIGWLPVTAYGLQLVAEPVVFGRLRVAIVASNIPEVAVSFGALQTGFAAAEFGADACGTVFHLASWVETVACAGARAGVVQAFVYNNAQIAGGAQGAFAAEVTGMLRLTPLGPAVVEIGAIGRVNFTQYALPRGAASMPPVYTQSIGAFVTMIRIGVHF